MADHSKPSQYDPSSPGGLDSPLIIIVGLISVAIFIVTVVALEAWFNGQNQSLLEEGYRGNPKIEMYKAAEAERVNKLDRRMDDPNYATVPLDFAINQFVDQQSNK